MEAKAESDVPRVIHWCIPRSLSTVFMRSIMTNTNIKVFFEPYIAAYYFGNDRLSNRYEEDIKKDTSGSFDKYANQTCKSIKATLEADYPDKEAIFVKNMAYFVWQHANNSSILPDGYIHTFQMRNPRKTIPSLYNMTVSGSKSGENYFDPKEVGFKELRQLYDHVTNVLGQEAIVIDSDDLACHPESIIKQYCHKTGLQFKDTMLDWSACPIEDMSPFQGWESWLENMLNSTHFIPPSSKKIPVPTDSLPEIIQQCINEALPHYEHMYANRIVP